VTLLHKNRDNVARPQCAHLKGIEVAGRRIFRFMANGDTSDMGTMMALNEMGLAIVADTGAPDPHPRQLGMMNTDTMRIIAESAADVDEALELFREFQKNRVYAGGKIGTNWLLADRRGRGLRLYQFHEALLEKRPEDGLLVMRDEDARGILVKKALSGRRGRITAGLFNKLSRQKPVLAPSNISAYTAVIPAEQTEIFSYAYFALGQAGKTLYVPLYMGVQATPRSLVNGSFFRLSTTHPFGENLFERCQAYKIDLDEFEQDMEEDRANMESVARHVLQREGQDAARRILTEGCMRFARRVEHTLRHLCIER
jgi:hypothetical protein